MSQQLHIKQFAFLCELSWSLCVIVYVMGKCVYMFVCAHVCGARG